MLPLNYYNNEQDHRRRQIDTLKIFNDHVTEIEENKEYRVEFLAGNKHMRLNIILGTEFPNEKPTIFVTPFLSHPWLAENSNEIVNAPGLVNYSVHADLGRIVQAIIREFQKFILSKSTEIATTSTNTSPQLSIENVELYPELDEMSVEDLQELLENNDLQDKMVDNDPELAKLETQKLEMMEETETLAQENLKVKQSLEELRNKVWDKVIQLIKCKENFQTLKPEYALKCKIYEPNNIREQLKELIQHDDEAAESIAEQFLTGEMPVDIFVNKYTEAKTQAIGRKVREERLSHQLAQYNNAIL